LALDIALGLEFIHANGFVHRDIKTPNVLLCYNQKRGRIVAKIADFGLAVSTLFTTTLSRGRAENPRYLAPELIAQRQSDMRRMQYTNTSDVYSYGVVLYELFYNRLLFDAEHFDTAIADHVRAGRRPPLDYPQIESINELIRACWAQQPADRISMGRVCANLRQLLSMYTRNTIAAVRPVYVGE
jgi:serine/threonine protein kinase